MPKLPFDTDELITFFNPVTASRLTWATVRRGWGRLWRSPGPNSKFLITTSLIWTVVAALTDPYKSIYLSELGLSNLAIGGFFAMEQGLRALGVLAGGFIDGAHGSYGAAQSVLQSGRGTAVAVSRKRMSKLPDVPSFAELGAKPRLFQLTGFQCCVVPAGTLPEIIQKLSRLLVAGGKTEKIQQLMKSLGVDDTAMTFEETQKLYKEEAPVWLEAVASLGLAPS